MWRYVSITPLSTLATNSAFGRQEWLARAIRGQTTTSSSQDLVEHTRVDFRNLHFFCKATFKFDSFSLLRKMMLSSCLLTCSLCRRVRRRWSPLGWTSPSSSTPTPSRCCSDGWLSGDRAFKNGGFLNGGAQEFHSQSGLAMGKGKSQPCRANLQWTRGRYRRWPLASSSLDSPPGSGHLDVTALVANTRRKKNCTWVKFFRSHHSDSLSRNLLSFESLCFILQN